VTSAAEMRGGDDSNSKRDGGGEAHFVNCDCMSYSQGFDLAIK